jgi:hypothetical protein
MKNTLNFSFALLSRMLFSTLKHEFDNLIEVIEYYLFFVYCMYCFLKNSLTTNLFLSKL